MSQICLRPPPLSVRALHCTASPLRNPQLLLLLQLIVTVQDILKCRPFLCSVTSESFMLVIVSVYFISYHVSFLFLGYEANPDGIDDCQKLFEAEDDAYIEGEEVEVEVDMDMGEEELDQRRHHGAEDTGQGHLSESESGSDGDGMQGERGTDSDICQEDIDIGFDIGRCSISDGDIDDDDGADDSGRSSRSADSVCAQSVCDVSCHLVKASV